MQHRRDGVEDGESTHVQHENGQICHRIYGHYGDCLFDRPPEFEPARLEARPLVRPRLRGPASVRTMGSTWRDR
jgi:hypothetical protein